ncbi:MAG: glutamate--tRNA ligase [Gemmatimonadota bacterium]
MVRTRFAPSPTGQLHLGNARIAVFNWLFTRHHGGSFVLRVEDTDVDRNVEGSLESILEDLRWLGLHWDEGPDVGGDFGPYRQSQREALHQAHAETLLEAGAVYPCTCPAPTDETPGGGCVAECRNLDPTTAHQRWEAGAALRFRVPDGPVTIRDAVRGEIRFPADEVRDFVILRADGRPTYNFAVVVDDFLMEITHVIRGAGHLSNTPKHQLLFQAFGARVPVFAHLPTVLAPGGGKLSKRGGAPGLDRLRKEGYHPDGVVNYLSLLGWSPGDDREVMDMDELAEALELDRVRASDTIYDPEKLRWMSGQHVARMDTRDLALWAAPFFPPELAIPSGARTGALDAIRTRLSILSDLPAALEFLYPPESSWAPVQEAIQSHPQGARVVAGVRDALREVDEWKAPALGQALRGWGKANDVKGPALFKPVRLALMASEEGPDVGKAMEALGRKVVLSRLDRYATPRMFDGI